MIEGVADKVDQNIGGKWKAGPEKDAALALFSGCIADFTWFKDVLRNVLFHNRTELFKKPDADSALMRATECFVRLAVHISEREPRLLTRNDFRK